MEGLIFGILRYVLSLNFKNLLFRVLRKKPCSCQCLLLYLGFSLSLLQFQLIFVSSKVAQAHYESPEQHYPT